MIACFRSEISSIQDDPTDVQFKKWTLLSLPSQIFTLDATNAAYSAYLYITIHDSRNFLSEFDPSFFH